MSADILIVFVLLGLAMVVFTFEWLQVDLVALLLVAALIVTGVLSADEAFSGFANETLVVLAAVFILSGSLVKTGVLDWLGELLGRVGGRREPGMVGSVMGLSAALSAFLSNTNVTAVLIPGVLEFARKCRVSPSRLLMPLAFASMLGGTCTLIGTSTNMAASGLFDRLGLAPISLFELAPVGLIVVVVGIAYMALVGYRLLPDAGGADLARDYMMGDYLAVVTVAKASPLVGLTLAEAPLSEQGVAVLEIRHGETAALALGGSRLAHGDRLLVQAPREKLLALAGKGWLEFKAGPTIGDKELLAEGAKLSEAIVLPRSSLVGKTLRGLDFRRRYAVTALALRRRGRGRPVGIADIPLRVGDVLLVRGIPERLADLERSRDLWLLGDVEHLARRRRKGLVTLGALLAAIVAGSFGWLPLSVALLLAAVAVVLAGAISAEEMYTLVEWRLLILIGGMTSFGLAMEKTGAADYLAVAIAGATEGLGHIVLLAAFLALTMLLTQPLSNAAAALVVLPVAISTAAAAGAEPRSFALMVTLAASLSFITPLEPACLLVYGPGKYRFWDYVKVGTPLSAIVLLLLVWIGPMVWPL